MQQQYEIVRLDRLLASIKNTQRALKIEDHEIFNLCDYESIRDMGEIMIQACDRMRWGSMITKESDKMLTGKCGEFEFCITGCCCADISLYHEETGLQLDIQPYEEGYKLMFCDDVSASFANRADTINAICYFMETKKKTPSLLWIADPEIAGWEEAKELGWC